MMLIAKAKSKAQNILIDASTHFQFFMNYKYGFSQIHENTFILNMTLLQHSIAYHSIPFISSHPPVVPN